MSTEPPGDSGDAPKARPWISDDDEVKAPPSEGSHSARKVRMVGSVVDPAVDDDGLSLSGPGAPGRTFSAEPVEHPVRARLLEKARRASDPGAPPQAPAVAAPEPAPAPLPAYAGPEPRFSESADPPEVESAPTTDTTSAASASEAPSSVAPPVEPIAPSPVTPTAEAPSVSPDSSTPPVEAPIPSSQLTPPPGAVASELERIARRPAQSAPGPSLSPNMVAVLGGLVGLTVISTLGVFLSRTKSEAVDVPAATQPVEEQPQAPEPPKVERPKRQKVPGPWRIQDDASKPGNKVLKGKIGKNAFLRAIQDAGLPKSEAYRVYGALKDQLDLDHCKKTDSFLALVSGREKTLIAFEYIVTKEEVYQVKENKQGRLEGNKLDLKVARNQIRRSFTHDGKSFEESARRAGFDPGISSMAEVSLRGHSSMSDFKAGDRIRVIAQEVTVLGEFSRYSGVEAMEINRAGEEPRRIYYYPHPIEGGHFDKNGRAPYEGGWRKPIPNAVRTSPFNPKRMHPILKKIRPHNGTDFGCSTGTPIGATSPGTIVVRGLGGGYGNLVRIKHDGGYESGYAHLSRFESGQKIGDRVERMQTIGYCGSTGRSTGPHLHFEMKKDGVYIDAETLSLDGLRVLPKAHRNEFAEVRAKYDPILDKIPLPEPMAAPAPAPTPTAPEAAASNPMVAEPAPVPGPGPTPSPAPSPAAAPAPAPAAQPAPSAPAQPAQPQAPSAIFLTDTELLKMQSATDDGEVAE